MKEIILQKSNFRCRENIYICRPLMRLWRLAVVYVKKQQHANSIMDTLISAKVTSKKIETRVKHEITLFRIT